MRESPCRTHRGFFEVTADAIFGDPVNCLNKKEGKKSWVKMEKKRQI